MTSADDLFHLRWNDHFPQLIKNFGYLLESDSFTDVTIATDTDSLKCHKLILISCSPFFEAVLKDNPCSHPVIILPSIPHSELVSILKFIYAGEVQIREEELNDFLQTAQLLQIKGLTDIPVNKGEDLMDLRTTPPGGILIKALEKDNESGDEDMGSSSSDCEYPPVVKMGLQSYPPPGTSSGDYATSPTSRVRATDPRPCPKCNKIYRSAHTLRTHLEDKHTICPGYRCVLCGTVAKSRNSLHSHMSRQHRGISTKDLPVLPMPAPFDPKLASRLLGKAGMKFDEGDNVDDSGAAADYRERDTTGSAILDTYLQFIAENSLISMIAKQDSKMKEEIE